MTGITACLSETEQKIYERIEPPETLVLLHVSLDVSLQRKPGHTSREVAPKIQAIERMDRRGLHIIDIDADQPFGCTVSQIKAALCNIL